MKVLQFLGILNLIVILPKLCPLDLTTFLSISHMTWLLKEVSFLEDRYVALCKSINLLDFRFFRSSFARLSASLENCFNVLSLHFVRPFVCNTIALIKIPHKDMYTCKYLNPSRYTVKPLFFQFLPQLKPWVSLEV